MNPLTTRTGDQELGLCESNRLESPITSYPDFEHLEAKGQEEGHQPKADAQKELLAVGMYPALNRFLED